MHALHTDYELIMLVIVLTLFDALASPKRCLFGQSPPTYVWAWCDLSRPASAVSGSLGAWVSGFTVGFRV